MLFAIVRTSNINMAILLTKLEKGLSDVRALNLVISRRCKTLVNETNQTKTQNKIVFDSGVHPGDSGFQVMGLGLPRVPGFKRKSFLDSRSHKQKFCGFWNPDYLTVGHQ